MKKTILFFALLAAAPVLSRLPAQTTPTDSLVNQLWTAAAEARDKGLYNESLALYDQAVSRDPTNADLLNSRGVTYFNMGMSGKYADRADSLVRLAAKDLSRALLYVQQGELMAEILINRGAANGALGDLEDALLDLNAGLKLDPQNKNGYLNRALIYISLEQLDKAIDDHTHYLKIDPDNANILYERGMLFRVLQRNKKAIKDLNRAIKLQPDLGWAYLERARAHAQAGHKAAARKDYLRAQQFNIPLTPADIQLMQEQ